MENNMFNCDNDLRSFQKENVTLNSVQRSEMRERRDANRRRLNGGLKKNDDIAPSFHQSQGSYAMHTMVQNDENDYDIDDGVVFLKDDLVGSQGSDKTALNARKMVYSALDDNSFHKSPEILKNCVRVFYQRGYHVDIPVYRQLDDGTLELASSEWKGSSPSEITEWYKNAVLEQSPDTINGRQLRRVTRLMKAYKDSRNSWKSKTASGFIVSVLVVECYVPDNRDDVSFYKTICAIYNRLNENLEVVNPVRYETLTKGADNSRTKFLREKIGEAKKHLKILFDIDCTRLKALEAWKKLYPCRFWDDRIKIEQSKQDKASLLRKGNSSLAPVAGLFGLTKSHASRQIKQTQAYGGKIIGKLSGGPWYSSERNRILFEKNAINEYPSLTGINRRKGAKKWREYHVKISLQEYYVTRSVSIIIYPNKDSMPQVKVNGSSKSPHRYDNGQLCMWYPKAPKTERWIFKDGLLHLLVMIEAHLFREAWWRETREWLGPEQPHGKIALNI